MGHFCSLGGLVDAVEVECWSSVKCGVRCAVRNRSMEFVTGAKVWSEQRMGVECVRDVGDERSQGVKRAREVE